MALNNLSIVLREPSKLDSAVGAIVIRALCDGIVNESLLLKNTIAD